MRFFTEEDTTMKCPLRLGCCVLAIVLAWSGPAMALTSDPTWERPELVVFGVCDYSAQMGSHRSLAFDHHGNPGVAYYNAAGTSLCFARRVPGIGWVGTTVDDAAAVGNKPCLAFDRYERPAISYYDDTADDLKYAHFNGTGWDVMTVESAGTVGWSNSLAFDLYGRPAIAYRAGTTLKYIADTDGDFRLDDEVGVLVVGAFNEGVNASLAFDPLNRPFIAHHDQGNMNLRLSAYDPTVGWRTTTVDDAEFTGYCPSLAIDPDTGFPAIAYRGDGSYITFAWWDGTAWQLEQASPGSGYYASLVFDPADGNPVISYTKNGLNLSYYDGTKWQAQTVDGMVNAGGSSSIAFNDYGTGFPAIAYFVDHPGATDDLYFVEDPPAVPEPAAVMLLLAGAVLLRRRRGES
jgi:hypothetical protein